MENLRITEREVQTGIDLDKPNAIRARDENFVQKLNFWEQEHSLGCNKYLNLLLKLIIYSSYKTH